MSHEIRPDAAAESCRSPLALPAKSIVGAAAAGTVAAATLSVARFAHAAGTDTIKIALIGCGGRGTGAANNALGTKGSVKLIAMADAFEERLARSLKLLKGEKPDLVDVPKERQFVGFDAYQKAIDAGPDLVILTTPPGFRPIHFEAAVKAGKHVFMEKPVAVDSAGIRSVLASAAEARKKRLAVAVGLEPPSGQLPGGDAPDSWRRHRRRGLHAGLLEQRRPRLHPPRSRRFRDDLPDAELVVLQLARRRPESWRSTST